MEPTSSAGLYSTLTCPACGARSEERMPIDVCIYFHQCASCGTLLRPLPGHCCVFCSYGSVPCPPVQQSSSRCPNGGAEMGVTFE